jgi:hypothetical protein
MRAVLLGRVRCSQPVGAGERSVKDLLVAPVWDAERPIEEDDSFSEVAVEKLIAAFLAELMILVVRWFFGEVLTSPST